MGEIIEVFKAKNGRPPKYWWDHWTDGKVRRLYRHRDFDADVYNFQNMLHREARRRGLKAKTKINKGDSSIEVVFRKKAKQE